MLILDGIYFLLLVLLSPLLLLAFIFHPRFRTEILGRLTVRNPSLNEDRLRQPKIWFHGASVGEVLLAIKVMERWKKEPSPPEFILTTNTKAGLEVARQTPWLISFFSCPDFSFLIKRFRNRHSISGLILIETEIWPNFIHVVSQKVPIGIINGRLSDRHFHKYRKYPWLFKPLVGKLNFVIAGDATSYERFQELGVQESRISFPGNLKFEPPAPLSQEKIDKIRGEYYLSREHFIFVAGSIQPEELHTLIPAYFRLKESIPQIRFYIIPRHPHKRAECRKIIDSYSLDCYFASSGNYDQETFRQNSFHVLDEIGILREWYSLADSIFVGGSLCPRGGQNMIEAIVLKKPVCIGPFYDNFKQEVEILQQGDGMKTVRNTAELVQFVQQSKDNPEWAKSLGQNGYNIILKNSGALEKIVAKLKQVWNPIQ